MPAYLSIMAIAVPHVLGGTYMEESVFSYPGIGALSYESARYHDYNLLMLLYYSLTDPYKQDPLS